MQWTEDMSTGVPVIDDRHRELVKRLNSLRVAIRKQICRYTVDNMLAFLEEYAEVHFCEEEHYMKYYGYPDYLQHKEKHDKFAMEGRFLRDEMHNIRTLGLKGSYELSVETVQVVVDWFHDHILMDDRDLGEYLRRHASPDIDGISTPCEGEASLSEGIQTLCSICHKIRGSKGLWRTKEKYKAIPSDTVYSHGICPECLQVYYSDLSV